MIDTHCHIDLYPKPHVIVKECDDKGISTIAVTNCPEHFKVGYPHIEKSKSVRLALGLHPILSEHTLSTLREFKELIDMTSYVGEVGLDFSKEQTVDPSVQVKSFAFILEVSSSRPRIMSIHSRQAVKDVISMMQGVEQVKGIFHWYSGSIALLEELQSQGHYISVNTAMFQSNAGRQIIKEIDKSRVLTESDGPYIAIGQRRARPSDMGLVLEGLAEIWGTPPSEAEEIVDRNFGALIAPVREWRKKRDFAC